MNEFRSEKYPGETGEEFRLKRELAEAQAEIERLKQQNENQAESSRVLSRTVAGRAKAEGAVGRLKQSHAGGQDET